MAEKKKGKKSAAKAPAPPAAEFAGDITANGRDNASGRENASARDGSSVRKASVKTEIGADIASVIVSGADRYNIALVIAVNVMLVLAGVMICAMAFDVSGAGGYSVFSYFSSGYKVRARLGAAAGGWADGAYVLTGITMLIAVLVPLALAVKNLVVYLVKREARINALDGAAAFAVTALFVGTVNICGANMTAGHTVAYVVTLAVFALYLVVSAARRGDMRSAILPTATLAAVTVALFTLTASPVWTGGGSIYAAGAASRSGIAAIAFVMLAAAVVLLAAISAMQAIKVSPALGFAVNTALAVAVTAALVLFAVSAPRSFGSGGAYVFGSVFCAILCVGYALTAPVMKKRA